MDLDKQLAAASVLDNYGSRLAKLKNILCGDISTSLHLQFLYSHNKTDLLLLKTMKV